MTPSARALLEVFADRFASSSQARGGRPLSLRAEHLAPFAPGSPPDTLESALEAAEFLEGEGVFSLSWARYRRGEVLERITLADPVALYRLLARPFPGDELEASRLAARRAAELFAISSDSFSPERLRVRALFSWLADTLEAADIERGADAPSLEALALLFDALFPAPPAVPPLTTPRALSIRLYNDSKALEALLSRVKGLLARASRSALELPKLCGLERSFPQTLVAGALRYVGDDLCLEVLQPVITGFPLETARLVERVAFSHPDTAMPSRVLGVENLETFHVIAALLARGAHTGDSRYGPPRYGAIIYVGGHPNRAVQALFAAFARSRWELYHSGDLDPEGILILQELADAAGSPVWPVAMDRETFDRYRSHGRPLDAGMLVRAARIRDDTRKLPGIEDLLGALLSSAIGVEQELMDPVEILCGSYA